MRARFYWLLPLLLRMTPARAQQVPPLIPLDSFRGDTAKFVETNVNNRRALYRNQKLEVFMRDLPLPIKSYLVPLNVHDATGSNKLVVCYSDAAAYGLTRFPKEGVFSVVITLEKSTPFTVYRPMYKASEGAWLQPESDYFGNCIVKDIAYAPPLPGKRH